MLETPYKGWMTPSLPDDAKIALCFDETDVQYFTSGVHSEIKVIIALTPEAVCQCHLMGISYYKIEDFYDVTVLCDADEPMIETQKQWSDLVDQFICNAIPEFKEYGFRPAGHYFFLLKLLIDMLYQAVMGLSHLLLIAGKRKIICFASDTEDDVQDNLFFNDSVFRLALPLCAAKYNTEVVLLRSQDKSSLNTQTNSISITRYSNARNYAKMILPGSAIRFLRNIRHGDFNDLRRFLGSQEAVPAIVYDGYYDIDPVIALARKDGLTVATVKEFFACLDSKPESCVKMIDGLMDVWQQLKSQIFFLEIFQWLGVDLSSVAESRLRHWWFKIVPKMWQSLLQARLQLQRKRAGVIAMAVPWEPEDYGILQAARSLGIPTVTFQHGGFIGYCEDTMLDMTDLRNADFRIVYGEGTRDYHQQRARSRLAPDAEVIAVGSSRLDSLREASPRAKKIRNKMRFRPSEQLVVYVPQVLPFNWYMCRENYLAAPYAELLLKVADIISQNKRHKFLYKPFPGSPDPVAAIIEKNCPRCTVVTDIPVTDLLQAGDAIIIDLPSTALLEALLSKKPILVFSDRRFLAFDPLARQMLEKRCIVTETADDFLNQLEALVNQQEFRDLENPDRDFLKAFGTHLDDGFSARRSLDFLKNLINSGSVARHR